MAISELIQLLIITIIAIPLSGLLLMLTAKIFKLADQGYKTAIKVALVVGAVGFIFNVVRIYLPKQALFISILGWILVSVLLALWLIKTFYNLDWGKTLLVWLIWFIFYVVAFFIIVVIIASVVVGLLLGGVIKLPA